MRTKLIAIILLLLLEATPYAQMAYAGTVAVHGDEDVNRDDANDRVYEGIKSAAKARRDELLYLLELDLPPDVLENLEEALHAMDAAEETEEVGEATEQYLYALKQFRNTWQKFLSHSPEAAEESFEEIDESDKPSPEETEPPQSLEEDIRVAKEMRLVRVQEEARERIAAVGEHVDELKEYLSEDDSKVLEKALDEEARKLENIMDKVSNGEYDDAIDELMVTKFEIGDDIDEMEDEEAAETVKIVEELESRVRRTEERKKKKTEGGEDTSEEDDTIEAAKEELDKIKKEFKDKAGQSRKPDTDTKQKDEDRSNNGKSSNNGRKDERSNNGRNG